MTDYFPGVKTAELTVAPPRSEHGLRSMLHTIPKGKGWVFGLVDIDLKDDAGRERVTHIVASHLEHLASDLAGEANPPRRFEQMLAGLNADLVRMSQEINLKPEKFHAIIGLMTKSQIFLSGIGNLSALFLHKTADRRYSVYELDQQFKEPKGIEDKPFFVTVLDGEVHGGDVFYLATPLSTHALSLDELHDILVTLPPAGALQRIRQFVAPSQHYGAVSFAFTDEEKGGGPPRKANPIGSLEALQTSQERTATVLGESSAELSQLVRNIAQAAQRKLASPGTKGIISVFKRFASLTLQAGGKVLSGGIKLASIIFQYLTQVLQNIFVTSTNKMSDRGGEKKLSPQKKLALLFILAVIVIGSGLFFLTLGDKERAQAKAAFTQTVEQIEARMIAAEASLIYRNTDEARATLVEAATILESLPRDTPEQEQTATELANRLNGLQAKIRGISLVTPQLLASFQGVSPTPVLTSTVGTGGKILAFTNSLDVYRLDGLSTSWIKEEASKGSIEAIRSSASEGTNALVLDMNKQLGRADLTTHTLNPITSGANNLLSVEDITTYSGNLYALSAQSGQIVKMRPQGVSYEAGTSWVTARETDISLARALAIDGDVYVLTPTDIVKFRTGREIAWPHAAIDPALSNPTDIWTDISTKYLYILDPGANRILVMVKESGAIEAQYTTEELGKAIGFIVEETSNRIVFVTSDSAYSFTADHLLK